MYDVACPSGLVFTARKLQLSEMLELAEAAEARAVDGGLTRVLSAVWHDLIEAGPYPFQPGAKPGNWDPLLEGDALSALRRIRIESLGADVEMNFKCEHCGAQQDDAVQVNISTLTERPYPADALRAHFAGSRYRVVLSTKETVECTLNTLGGHRKVHAIKTQYRDRLRRLGDPRAAKAMRPAPYDPILQCVVSASSLGDQIRDAQRFVEWCINLGMDDYELLKSELEQRVGGIETKVEAACAFCDWRQEDLHLPLAGAFWKRSKRKPLPPEEPALPTTA